MVPVHFVDFVNIDDVFVAEIGRGLGLLAETSHVVLGGQTPGKNHLHGHRAP